MLQVKHNIMLRDFDNDWLLDKKPLSCGTMSGKEVLDKKPLSCGTMSGKEVLEYLEGLSNIDKIPQDSCVTSFDAGLYYSKMTFINTSEKIIKEWVHDLKIDLRYKPEHECRCKRDDCFKNIESGKCIDPFMIEHVGKKFFAEKYQNKQK